MSAMAETICSVAVGDLVLDDAYQVRDHLDQSAIRRYADMMRAGADFPAIKVAKVQGAAVVIDGWHRVSAAKLIGRPELPAVIVDREERELAWLATEANIAHGVPLKRAEIRNAFRAYVRAGRHRGANRRVKSSREIAKDLFGLTTHTTVMAWMKSDFHSIWREMSGASDEPKADGGLPDVDPEERRMEAIRTSVREITAHARGVSDQASRGEILELIQAALMEVREAAPWEPMTPADF